MRDSPRDADAIEIILATFIHEKEKAAEEDKIYFPERPNSTIGSDYDAATHVLREWRGTI